VKNENNTIALFTKLKEQGYKVVVADPGEEGILIEELDVDNKIALVFGNELRGISMQALALCDERVRIPMYGFTESFNISVSAAICLNTLVTKQHASGKFDGLSNAEKELLKLKWYRKIVRKSDLIEREFLRTIE
jgi:tRNA (guanosine-2'-O-)-methyltransferase